MSRTRAEDDWLEHVCARLGVTDRLSAVVRARLLGVLPSDPARGVGVADYAVVRIPPPRAVT